MTQENIKIEKLILPNETQKENVRSIVMKHLFDVWEELSPSVQIEFLNEVLKKDPRQQN